MFCAMRDVVTGFYSGVLRKQLAAGAISTSDRVIVVCGGPLDEAVMRQIGFSDFIVTGIDRDGTDAENLVFESGSFDVAIVHAGLHHCYSPHRALLEMYRVARKQVLVFESRDSFLMRLAVWLGLTLDYETDSVVTGKGGVADTGVPNFIYRWTEREVEKTVASFDPSRPPNVNFSMISASRSSDSRALAIAFCKLPEARSSHFLECLLRPFLASAMNSLLRFQRPANCIRGSNNPDDVVADNRRLHVVVRAAAAFSGGLVVIGNTVDRPDRDAGGASGGGVGSSNVARRICA